MISNACTRIDIGASAGSVPPSAQPSLICGDSDDDHPGVHHVGVGRQLGRPAGRAGDTGGLSASGSTGRSSSRASTGAAQAAQNHTGNGTP